jgi:hypothetical protein
MSVEVMSQVFKRYPAGGNERLLALAIADHARADGSHVYPSVALLAEMTKQSERSVQRLIYEMLASGWLLLVRKSTGRRGDTNEYRISPEWLAGGDCVPPPQVPDRRTEAGATGDKLAPVQPVEKPDASVDNLSTTGDTQGLSGDIAVSPNPSLPVNTVPPIPPVETGGCAQQARDSPKPKGPKDRAPWRWADKRSGIEERAEALGIGGWDERAWVRGDGPDFTTFKARVFASHLAQLGVTTSPQIVARAMTDDKANNHSALLRRLAGHTEETP